jgi:hypothetical protein
MKGPTTPTECADIAPPRRLVTAMIVAGSIVGVAFIILFVTALWHSSHGEVAGALGGVVGGMLAAGAAVLAVRLTISQQRREDSLNVNDAIITEVTAFAKYVIGSVEICQKIASREIEVPREKARYIVSKLWGGPVIYSAVADRIGLLRHPNAATEFYMRLAECRAMIESLLAKTEIESTTFVGPTEKLKVTKEEASIIADSLITALQLAYAVITDKGGPSAKTQLAIMIRDTTLRDIDKCLASAKVSFPNAESFKTT